MAFKLQPLPYDADALAPHISAEALELHHGGHLAKYVSTLNEFVEGTHWEGHPLEQIDARSAAWANREQRRATLESHLSPKGGGNPTGKLADRLRRDFGDFGKLRDNFGRAASEIFGSGWGSFANRRGRSPSARRRTRTAPWLVHGWVPLLTCDMWEHAYNIDYRNEKANYLDAFWNVANWDFAAAQSW